MGNKKFIPLNGYLTVREIKEKVVENGLLMDEVKKKVPESQVVDVSEEAALLVKGGDIIVYNPNNSFEFQFNGEKLQILNKDALFGKYDQ